MIYFGIKSLPLDVMTKIANIMVHLEVYSISYSIALFEKYVRIDYEIGNLEIKYEQMTGWNFDVLAHKVMNKILHDMKGAENSDSSKS